MKISKTLLQTMMVAVTAGIVSSCEKPTVDAPKKPAIEKTKTNSAPEACLACGMG